MKKEDTNLEVKCPECGHLVPVSEVLRHQVSEELKIEMGQKERAILLREKNLEGKEKDIEEKERGAQKQIDEKVKAALSSRQQELDKRESDLAAAEEQTKKAVAAGVEAGLKKQMALVEEKAKKKAQESVSVEMKDMTAQLTETREKLEKAEATELALRKRERELEEKEKTIKLQAARELSAQKAEIEEAASARFAAEHRLKDLEKDKVVQDLKNSLEEANRRAQVGSQQLQGEVQELDVETFLKEQFPFDEIVPVAKGVRGGDALHKVNTKSGSACGSILWESKRTKSWVEGWISKLKDDQREAKADLAVIITDVLPKGITTFGYRNGVWITNMASFHGLATVLRMTLTEVATTKLAAEGKDEKVEVLFRYLTGPEFRQKVSAMVETFLDMKGTIDREKRAALLRWSKQEKQLERVIGITIGMHGDLRGLIGSSMQAIPLLEEGGEDAAEQDSSKEAKVESAKPVPTPSTDDIDPDDIPF